MSRRLLVELVVGGAADEVILDYAEEKKFDLIVMTTYGRSGVYRWIFGNVTQRVLRHSLTPVLIVPPTGFRNH
jgi:nucleotide-binding universal stress UspA family protein